MENTNLAVKKNLNFKEENERQVAYRTGGTERGPIVRLVSPGDLGHLIKPFVFLDRFNFEPTDKASVKQTMADFYHPHSGIMTVTTLICGELRYEDTTGAQGILPAGGIEYMQAGGGVWHTGTATGSKSAKGFQLWIALPPELENAKSQSTYLPSKDVPMEGAVRVILGAHGNVRSQILPHVPMNYLHVSLKDGEGWSYQPPKGHNIAWVAVREGELKTGQETLSKEVVIFEEGNQALEFVAQGTTDFVLGSAVKHPHPLVLGSYSVHTNSESLKKGWAEIERIRKEFRL